MAKAADILKRIQDEGIEWVDLRFTDPKGKWQHLTMVASVMGEDELEDGLMFDGSSIEGWKAILLGLSGHVAMRKIFKVKMVQ